MKNETQDRVQLVADTRIRMLADRLAILLVVCNGRDGDDWDPWMGEGMYEDEGSLGDHVREMKDYRIAKDIVRLWIKKSDKKALKELKQ